MIKLIQCGCDRTPGGKASRSAAFQDERYGVGIRVHNKAGGKDSSIWRCTICGNEKKKEDKDDDGKKGKKQKEEAASSKAKK